MLEVLGVIGFFVMIALSLLLSFIAFEARRSAEIMDRIYEDFVSEMSVSLLIALIAVISLFMLFANGFLIVKIILTLFWIAISVGALFLVLEGAQDVYNMSRNKLYTKQEVGNHMFSLGFLMVGVIGSICGVIGMFM